MFIISGFLLVTNNVYGDNTNKGLTGNYFYDKWKDYKYVFIDEKGREADIYANAMTYSFYLIGYRDTTYRFNLTELPHKITYRQICQSFGNFLENNPEIRHYDIQILLHFWEKVTFEDRKLENLKKSYKK